MLYTMHQQHGFSSLYRSMMHEPASGSIIGGYVPERIDFVWTNCQVAACDTVLARIPGSDLFYSGGYGSSIPAC